MTRDSFLAICQEHGCSALEAEFLYMRLEEVQPGWVAECPAEVMETAMRENFQMIEDIRQKFGAELCEIFLRRAIGKPK
jgi:hypothetical protein